MARIIFDPMLNSLRTEPTITSEGDPVGMQYSINGIAADITGNFNLTPANLGSAPASHTHTIATVPGLEAELLNKAPVTHKHELVSTITVNGENLTGEITIEPGDNMLASVVGQTITLTPIPFVDDISESVSDANTTNTNPLKVFSGTQAEWDAFTPEENVNYIVFITE